MSVDFDIAKEGTWFFNGKERTRVYSASINKQHFAIGLTTITEIPITNDMIDNESFCIELTHYSTPSYVQARMVCNGSVISSRIKEDNYNNEVIAYETHFHIITPMFKEEM